jgi:hypothetical protein
VLLIQLAIFTYIQFNSTALIKESRQCALNTKPVPIQLTKNLDITQYATDKYQTIKLALPPETIIESKNSFGETTIYKIDHQTKLYLTNNNYENIKKSDLKKSQKEIADIYKLSSFVEYDLLQELMNHTGNDVQAWNTSWSNWQIYKTLVLKKTVLTCEDQDIPYYFTNNNLEGYIIANSKISHFTGYIKIPKTNNVYTVVYSGPMANLNDFTTMIESIQFTQ